MITKEDLRIFRKNKKWSLKKLGTMVGYSESALSMFENGVRPIPERLASIVYLMNTVDKLKKK